MFLSPTTNIGGMEFPPFHLQEISYRRRPAAPWNYEIMQNMFHARFKFNGRGGGDERGNAEERRYYNVVGGNSDLQTSHDMQTRRCERPQFVVWV